jgi:hypothetical protein
MLRYVGDSKGLRSRVRQHCIGNVESSALRKTIATAMGFEIISTKRPSGSRKISVESASTEQIISAYIQSGSWRVVVCATSDEAREFQWYAIDKLRPPLNKLMQFWEEEFEAEYENLLNTLLESAQIQFETTLEISRESGVYSLWHEQSPVEFSRNLRA